MRAASIILVSALLLAAVVHAAASVNCQSYSCGGSGSGTCPAGCTCGWVDGVCVPTSAAPPPPPAPLDCPSYSCHGQGSCPAGCGCGYLDNRCYTFAPPPPPTPSQAPPRYDYTVTIHECADNTCTSCTTRSHALASCFSAAPSQVPTVYACQNGTFEVQTFSVASADCVKPVSTRRYPTDQCIKDAAGRSMKFTCAYAG
jgi:hypothetical protein